MKNWLIWALLLIGVSAAGAAPAAAAAMASFTNDRDFTKFIKRRRLNDAEPVRKNRARRATGAPFSMALTTEPRQYGPGVHGEAAARPPLDYTKSL